MTDVSTFPATGPLAPPIAPRDIRWELASELLRGRGIEIGALHLPMRLPDGASARYVDRMTVSDLRHHYKELAELPLTPVDIVDDGELLTTIAPESVDFIVANHFLEHCEDPIRTIGTHLGKLRPGGILFYAVPDKRYTFDWQRETTPLEHIVADHELGAERSRTEHYRQWVALVDGTGVDFSDPDGVNVRAAELEAEGYSVHFHVWTQTELLTMFLHIREHYGSFDIAAFRPCGIENIIVLRKHGTLVPEATPPPSAPAPPSAPPPAPTPAPPEHHLPPGTIPLSVLREQLDTPASHWEISGSGRALHQPIHAPVTFPLRLNRPVTFRVRAMLPTREWSDGTGGLRVRVTSTGPDGAIRELWAGVIASAAAQGNRDGILSECELPGETTALHLHAEPVGPRRDRAVATAVWAGAEIVDPVAAADPGLTSSPRPGVTSADASVPTGGPLFSVLTPVHDPPLSFLQEAVDSVRAQTLADWELCLVDDGSTRQEIIDALERYVAEDPRIRLERHERAGGIASATNAALAFARGQYVALLDHDDTLAANALELVAERIRADPTLDMIYTDEDIVMDGRQVWVHHKPGWSPDTLRTNGYTCHLGVYRRTLMAEIGGFRDEFNGSQDVDMILRLVERTDRIAHVPRILYHWRAHPASTAGGDAKPYAYVAAARAISGHLERVGIDGRVDYGPPGLYRVAHHVPETVSVSLVLAVPDAEGLGAAARSWLSQPHLNWSVTLGAPADQLDGCVRALTEAGVAEDRITPVTTRAQAGTPLAETARSATGDHLLLMQGPMIGLTYDWLRRLLGYSAQPDIAAAGPVVLTPDGRVLHAGIGMPDGIPLHLLYGQRTSMDDHFGYGTSVYNVIALSGAVITSRATFSAQEGLRAQFGELALIDYCLRAGSQRIATIPDARLQAVVPQRGISNELATIWALKREWIAGGRSDPYYNPSYRGDRGDFRAASEN